MSTASNRRQYERVAVAAGAQFRRIPSADPARGLDAHLYDVSVGGLSLELTSQAEPGQYLKVLFTLPKGPGHEPPIAALIEVKWSSALSSGVSKVGGQFVAIRDADLSRLSKFISPAA